MISSRLVDKSARGAKEGEQLESIKVLVAESDLSMNWFVCGLLRDAEPRSWMWPMAPLLW